MGGGGVITIKSQQSTKWPLDENDFRREGNRIHLNKSKKDSGSWNGEGGRVGERENPRNQNARTPKTLSRKGPDPAR